MNKFVLKINLNILYLIPLIFIFLPALCIPIGKPIVIYYVLITMFYIFLLFFKRKMLNSIIFFLYKKTTFRYYIYFVIWITVSGIINVFLGIYKIKIYLYYLIFLILIDYTFTFLYPIIVYKLKKINIKKISKFLLIVFNVIFIIGLLEFFGKKFNINALYFISDALANQRFFSEYIYDSGGTRIKSVFAEPGWLGGFICMNMPLIYKLSLSKYKLFNNLYFNKIIKKVTIPFMWLIIILSQSAIWFVFDIIITFFYFRKNLNIIKVIKKYILLLILIFTSIIIFIINLENITRFDFGYYKRIIVFFTNILSFKSIVLTDPSLGTRLVSYYALIKLAMKHIFLGVGIGNAQYTIYNSLINSPILTIELISKINKSFLTNAIGFSSAIFYQYLAEIGIIGLSLFYLLLIKTIKVLKKIKNYFTNIEKDFLEGLIICIINLCFLTLYDIHITMYYIWFLLGLSLIFMFEYNNRRGKI